MHTFLYLISSPFVYPCIYLSTYSSCYMWNVFETWMCSFSQLTVYLPLICLFTQCLSPLPFTFMSWLFKPFILNAQHFISFIYENFCQWLLLFWSLCFCDGCFCNAGSVAASDLPCLDDESVMFHVLHCLGCVSKLILQRQVKVCSYILKARNAWRNYTVSVYQCLLDVEDCVTLEIYFISTKIEILPLLNAWPPSHRKIIYFAFHPLLPLAVFYLLQSVLCATTALKIQLRPFLCHACIVEI